MTNTFPSWHLYRFLPSSGAPSAAPSAEACQCDRRSSSDLDSFCRRRALSTYRARPSLSHTVFSRSFCRSQLPHKSVNLSCTITRIKSKLTEFCGNWRLQNDSKVVFYTLCETSPVTGCPSRLNNQIENDDSFFRLSAPTPTTSQRV